jgi:hypothetical protein
MRSQKLLRLYRKWWIFLILLTILPLIVHIGSGTGWSDFFLGSYEKHHGYLFWLGLIFFGIGTAIVDDKRKLVEVSTYTAGVVGLIGILEYLGLTLIPIDGDTSWGAGRIVSTLGNPNYVAWYLLIHLPLLTLIKKSEQRYTIGWLLVLATILTGSYIAIGLMVIYALLLLSRKVSARYGALILILMVLTSITLIWQVIPGEKKLSFETRGVLMMETLQATIDHPLNILIWYGPDSITRYFSWPRSEIIRAYIPGDHMIDSSHSIIIDTLYSYGLIIVLILGWMIVRNISTLDLYARDGLILGLIFFSLNVIVLAPLLVMISLTQKNKI